MASKHARKTPNVTTTRCTPIQKAAICRVLVEAGGDVYKAHEILKETPGMKAPAVKTLSGWLAQPEYKELEAEMAPEVAMKIAAQAERIALRIEEAERLAIDKVRERLAAGLDEQPAATLRNLSTSKALQLDKVSSPLRGRPTVIHSAGDIGELISALNARLGIASTAEDITDAQVLPSGDTEPNGS